VNEGGIAQKAEPDEERGLFLGVSPHNAREKVANKRTLYLNKLLN
jgi:hypothetical protein